MAPSVLPAVNTVMGSREWGLLLTLSFLWGGAFFFGGVAVQALDPFTIVAARVGLAAPVLWLAVMAARRRIPREPAVWRAFAVMGVINNVIPFSLIVWGQTQIPSGLASILNATTPLFTVLVAGLLLADERFSVRKGVAVAIGFGGVVVLIGGDVLTVVDAPVLAQCAVLLAALSYAFGGVFGRRFRAMGVDPLVTAAGQVTMSALVMVPLAAAVDRPWAGPMPPPAVLASLAGLAVLCTALAYGIYFRLLATAGATNLLLVTFLIPVTAILLGVAILDESLRPAHLAGMALIGLGLLVMDGRAGRALRGLWARGRPEAAP